MTQVEGTPWIRTMALREFTDSTGNHWKAWDVVPETLHPVTRAEDYLQGFLDGWLVFESPDASGKRRLYPCPAGWEAADDAVLERLCLSAEPVKAAAHPSSGASQSTESQIVRSFVYPSGRIWKVAEVPVQYRDADGKALSDTQIVLRFSSGRRNLDLLAWPPQWRSYSDEELADLLYRAFPRAAREEELTTARRRRGDPPPSGEGPDKPSVARPTSATIQLCRRLRADIPHILSDWQAIIDEEAGQDLPADYRLIDVGDLVLQLVEAAVCRPADLEAHRRGVLAAATHGTALRGFGIREDLIFQEYALLRRAFWYRLQWLERDGRTALDAIERIDRSITLATMATLHGYHREELEALGRWDEILRLLMHEAETLSDS